MHLRISFLFFGLIVFAPSMKAQSLKQLYDSLVYYYQKADYPNGIVAAEKLVSLAKKEIGESHPDYISYLGDLATMYAGVANYEKAELILSEALDRAKKILSEDQEGYYATYVVFLNNLAELNRLMIRYDKAESLFIESVAIRKKVLGESHPDYAQSLNDLAKLYLNTGRYEKAEPLHKEALSIRKKILGESHPDYAQSLNNLALLYKTTGRYDEAEQLYIQAISIDKKAWGENHPFYAIGLNNLGRLYETKGRYDKAEPLYKEALIIRKKGLGESHPDYAQSLNNLAVLYSIMGRYEKAESLHLEALAIRKKILGESDPDYAQSLNNLGLLYENMIRYTEAESFYKRALDICKKILGEEHIYYITSLANLGNLYQVMGSFEQAEKIYTEALAAYKKKYGLSHPDYAKMLGNLGDLYAGMERYDKAESLYLESREINKKALGESHPQYGSNLNKLVVLFQEMGRYHEAEPLLLQYSHIVTQNLLDYFSVMSESEKQMFINQEINLTGTANRFIYKAKSASPLTARDIANTQLFFKGLILENTTDMLASLKQSKDTAIQKTFKSWQGNKKTLSRQYSQPVANRRNDLNQIEEETNTLEKELNQRSATFRNQQNSMRINMDDIRKGLKKGEANIEFVKFEIYKRRTIDSTMYAAYVLNQKDSIAAFVPLFEERQLQKILDRAGDNPTATAKTLYNDLEGKNKNSILGNELYQLIWQPLELYLKGMNKISYSPAGKLYDIAFHALPADSKTVLMDKYALQQYTSTRQVALRNGENKNKKPTDIVLFGNASFSMDSLQLTSQRKYQKAITSSGSFYQPSERGVNNKSWKELPGTTEEVTKIKQLFDQNKIAAKVYTQTLASEENLKALDGKSPQILHIATHGFFLPDPEKKRNALKTGHENTYTLADDPLLRSGLVFAGGNYVWSGKTPIDEVEDGIATAYEISQLNLSNTELAVLSACETALGEIKGTEGVFGLQRALKMAGVKKMIVSLWKVPDKETAELMKAFYFYWIKGKTINESFINAQSDMRKKYSPFYWAAFVLVE